ncbi:E3 ubiquitin-protein ligase synoviolin [Verticillium nonalfalfae]|uniref:RING-type E3 ubiquitin transferase n=1 Tax=Verticillium nonalfalfae TaxID=1051616 RepID=A0A3M9Y6Y2_9PEZI|nr:E3 ubiquitin-protein ligase synoviolin [Verticillium nonalfalfae]RNJ54940.1 E3 ubiquitin-protein ligase synoviolin [Verticillium nonalfalfae]
MRLVWYAGVSTTLATAVVVSAFQQRANFYSAMVYLAQSNFCLLILINFVYLIYGTTVYGLQRIFYGPLRQTEVEQLSERAWFAITETCLAMTIFRDEIGAWFLVMFTALITGKVWGWIGDGRVEILEQQPPANPGLFHTRLSLSLLLSLAYDLWILAYTIRTVIRQARPDMMVMFLFEFAVLATCSARTGVRYLVSILESRIVKQQTKTLLEERRREVRQTRDNMMRQRAQEPSADGETTADQSDLPREEDVDEMDIEVPGWEEKGQWILILDLVADCTKFSIYIVFFFILFSFYGLPIHIMRDLFMTGRAVIKRGSALWKYRKAMEDMNNYADATQEDISREDTCIICREEMRPWDPANNPGALQRIRPKKLPCGHILHMGCLKSWLERQQVCPTCRRSVVINAPPAAANRDAALGRLGLGVPAAPAPAGQAQPQAQRPLPANGQNGGPQAPAPPAAGQPAPRNGGARVFNFGNLRVGFAQGGENIQELAQRMAQGRQGGATPGHPAPATPITPTVATPSVPYGVLGNDVGSIRERLREVERSIQSNLLSLQQDQQQLQLCNLLLAELNRLRQQQQQQQQQPQVPNQEVPHGFTVPTFSVPQQPLPSLQPFSQTPSHAFSRHGITAQSAPIHAGSQDLPEGVSIPPGWSLLPLQRLDGAPVPTTTQSTQSEPSVEPSSSTRQNEAVPPAATANGTTGGPEILAPNPVMPNWGGENQLFGRSRSSARDGNSDTTSTTDEPREKSPAVAPPASAQPTVVAGRAGEEKGKAKAVTVEDAGDDQEGDAS